MEIWEKTQVSEIWKDKDHSPPTDGTKILVFFYAQEVMSEENKLGLCNVQDLSDLFLNSTFSLVEIWYITTKMNNIKQLRKFSFKFWLFLWL